MFHNLVKVTLFKSFQSLCVIPEASVNFHQIFCQITQKFDEVMAVASSRRPAGSRKVYFDNDEITSSRARSLYEKRWIIDDFREEYFSNFTYSEALHIILAGFQCEPLSLKFAAMKKVLVLDLEVKDLPEVLQVSAEKVD